MDPHANAQATTTYAFDDTHKLPPPFRHERGGPKSPGGQTGGRRRLCVGPAPYPYRYALSSFLPSLSPLSERRETTTHPAACLVPPSKRRPGPRAFEPTREEASRLAGGLGYPSTHYSIPTPQNYLLLLLLLQPASRPAGQSVRRSVRHPPLPPDKSQSHHVTSLQGYHARKWPDTWRSERTTSTPEK